MTRGAPDRVRRTGCVVRPLLAVSLCLVTCACTVYRPVVTRPPTLGEELIQLDAAHRDGLLSRAEHDRLREETIAAWTRIGDAGIEPIPDGN